MGQQVVAGSIRDAKLQHRPVEARGAKDFLSGPFRIVVRRPRIGLGTKETSHN